VTSTTATDITVGEGIQYAYTTGDSSTVSKLHFKSHVYLEGCHFIGDGTVNQTAVFFKLCKDIHIVGCSTTTGQGFSFSTCIQFDVSDCVTTDSYGTSGYGVLVYDCSQWFSLHHNRFDKCRYGILAGASNSSGILRWFSIHHNTVYGADSSSIRVTGAEQWDVHHNQISGVTGTTGAYGIYSKCLNGKISDNKLIGPAAGGLYVLNSVDEFDAGAIPFWMEITGNIVDYPADGHGIYFTNNMDDTEVRSLVVSGNSVYGVSGGNQAVYLRIGGTSSMNTMVVSGNSVSGYDGTEKCLLIYASDTAELSNVSITGNSFQRENDTDNNVKILGNTTNDIIGVSVSGNNLVNGDVGVLATYEERICIVGNVIRNMSSSTTSVTAGSNTVASNV